MKRILTISFMVVLMLPAMGLWAQGGAGEVMANHTLDSPSYSSQLLSKLPPGDFELTLLVGYTKPGVVLDTVGLNAAPVGAWAVRVEAEGQLTFQVYDPGLQSQWRNQSGWHILQSTGKIKPGSVAYAVLTVRGLALTWAVDAQPALKLQLARPLANVPVWVGDFPGDDHWGNKYHIHPAMTGRLMVQFKPQGGSQPPVKPPGGDPVKPPGGDPVKPPQGDPVTVKSDPGQVIAKVEAALKAGDMTALLALIQPARREALGTALEASRDDLPKLGAWLAQRQKGAHSATVAEYIVTIEGEQLAVRLVKTENTWWLESL
jgi:hypothetical protein